MKIGFVLFLVLPLLGAVYVNWRIWHILPFVSAGKWCVALLFWVCLLIMVSNFFILDRIPLNLGTVLYGIGCSWLFILLYLFMIFLLLDIGRIMHIVPGSFLESSLVGSLSVLTVMLAVFCYGNVHYHNKVRVPIEETTSKQLSEPLRILMVSDLHLGYLNRRSEFSGWVDMLNGEKPDVILISGDVIDNSVRPLLEEGVAEEFRRLQAPVYACMGNHEYFGGKDKALGFFRDAGITLLRDSAIVVGDLCIIGRDDRSNPRRQSLGSLMRQADRSKYTILLDHQPYHLEQAERFGIDFQFSGHTHYGQVFPINLITGLIYEDAYGCWQRGNTRYYVSSGIGIWGGKFRIGTQSEYIVMTLDKK